MVCNVPRRTLTGKEDYAMETATRWTEERVLEEAARILEERVSAYGGETLSTPAEAGRIACLRIGTLEHEVFAVFWLDASNRLLQYEQLFRGTLTQTSVYPREVAKAALRHNAAAAILAHNHPSGTLEPSRADETLTRSLKETLSLVDVRVIDHLIVSGNRTRSMAELGML